MTSEQHHQSGARKERGSDALPRVRNEQFVERLPAVVPVRARTRSSASLPCLFALLLLVTGSLSTSAADPSPIDFNTDVRPILAANCFKCHGPDDKTRKAKLRLDTSAGAAAALAPGDPANSELFKRVTHSDSDELMPPADSNLSLTPQQIETLKHWIASGAEYETHWSFTPPVRPTPPAVNADRWIRNPIDRFVLARLEREGLVPSAEANRHTLIRRLYLDLIGLPPTPEEADAFVNDSDPLAYQKIVDRLLKSPRYGERWARLWLDLARYADTNGYEKDRPRSIWPYRDWVIRALNDDMPFDQFTIEQLAGDMLPNATLDQRIATGFHRNTMLNEEGGIDPLEYRFYAMVDRVATTGSVWLGLTTGCAQCHTHKYDPITHTDYYEMMALLNNADEPDIAAPDESLLRRKADIEARIANLEADLPNQFPPAKGDGPISKRRAAHLETKLNEWIEAQKPAATPWTIIRPTRLSSNLPKLELLNDGSIFSSGDITKRDVFELGFKLDASQKPITALRLEVLPDERLPESGPGRCYYEGRKGDFFLSELTAKADGKTVKFSGASHSFGKISIGSGKAWATNVFDGDGSTGWSTSTEQGKPHQLVLNFTKPISSGAKIDLEMLFERHFAASLGRFRFSATASTDTAKASPLPVEIEALLAREAKSWTEPERSAVRKHFLAVAPELAKQHKMIDALRNSLPAMPETMVMLERAPDNPRPTHRHRRGEYLKAEERVSPGLIDALTGATRNAPSNRLEFARWLASRQNPLAARVTVNRAWQALFGKGIVPSTADFGTQSMPRSHPELLDWLAVEFIDHGWSFKDLHRLLVSSATYRQVSTVTPELLLRDADNRLLARGPRFRVEAEMVRDIALQASGLLADKMGGPSVYPPQPESVTKLAYGNVNWNVVDGEDRYRRSLYTFVKRTAPFAAYLAFDGPTGENCIPRRERSNTPLQALTLLNDEMFLEAARALGRQAAANKNADPASTAAALFRRCLTRPPNDDELRRIVAYHGAQLARLKKNELDAKKLNRGQSDDPNQAAWTMVTRAILNLDETITKQ